MDIRNLKESEAFLRTCCNLTSTDDYFNVFLQRWERKWKSYSDIATDIHEKINLAFEEFLPRCEDENLQDQLQTAVECIILNKLHDYVVPLIYYTFSEEDGVLFEKCKELSSSKITAEQFGAPEDYAIPLCAAIVELATLDSQKSPVEKIHCLCTTYDLVFAELKSALIEIISRRSDKENDIPIIENCDIVPILMTVIVRAKVVHLHSHIYYIENFLWKLKDSENVMTTITVFKNAIEKIRTLTRDNLKPGCEKVCRDLDLLKVAQIMGELEVKRKQKECNLTLLDQHTERLSDLIYASTDSSVT